MAWGRLGPRVSISRERVARAATPLLYVRVVEGLAAWLLFNEFFFADEPASLVVFGAFVAHLLLNLLVALRYRRARISTALLGVDVTSNVLTLGPPVVASGGLASPLLLLFPLKCIQYAVVFSGPVAAVFLLATAAMLAAVKAIDRAGLVPVVPLGGLPPEQVQRLVQLVVLGLLVWGPLAIGWLRWVVAEPEGPSAEPVPERAGRDDTSALVAGALLTVSEAVSRLTRLDEILEKVVEISPGCVEVDYCGIALWREETGTYISAVAAGAGPVMDHRIAGSELKPQDVPDFEWVRRLGHCAVVPAAESAHVAQLDVSAVLIAPLVSGERFYGVMEFARRTSSRAFTQRDLTVADGIARQTAVALERARLIGESHRLVLAVESTEEAVLITDIRRRVIFANRAFMHTLGYRREEVIGRDAVELTGGMTDFVGELTEAVQRRSWRGETVVKRKDGTSIPIALNVSLFRDQDGRAKGAVSILQDISEQKKFQEQMQRVDRLAAVGEMAAGIAHEINNALTVIFGKTANGPACAESELRGALAQVEGQAHRIADIVQGVLGFARPRPPHPEPVALAAVAAKTLDLVRHDLVRQNVDLETSLDADLPPALADPLQLQQVLLNLFGNALQAMAGSERRWLRVEALGIDDRLALRVGDAGPGIAAEVLPRIFDPFFSTKSQGSGLGLSVSYAIARAHGGDLQVESEVGRGTTFTLFLPTAGPAEPHIIERILLVDDDPEVAEALTAMLAKEGLQVTRAATGAEAMARLESGSWDAVFLDVRLPDVSGPEVYAELSRTRPELAQRVVFVTGGIWRSESRLRQELPPQPILAKPCTQDQVREVLRRLRSQRRQAA